MLTFGPHTLWKGTSSLARLSVQPPCPNTRSAVGGWSHGACKASGGRLGQWRWLCWRVWGAQGWCDHPGIATRVSERRLSGLCHMADK